ncbi:MAG: GH39 family glycosyl hydrolase, partial [Pyrinomonadaceae bacterium]
PEPNAAYIQRIDEDHANAKPVWVDMGQPDYLAEKEVEKLEQASRLVKERQPINYDGGAVLLNTDLPPHAVAAITIEFWG